jgi:hypothetical protein
MWSISSLAKGRTQKIIEIPKLANEEIVITREIDCEAGMVLYIANSKTYNYAITMAAIPIRDTLLLYKEVCSGTNN